MKMGEEKIIENKNQNHRNKKRNVREQFRVILGNKANESLERIVHQVNDNFNCGTITKSNVVDWLLTKLNGSISPTEVKTLRELHIDEKKMLQDLLKESTTPGSVLPPDIRGVLRNILAFMERSKKDQNDTTFGYAFISDLNLMGYLRF